MRATGVIRRIDDLGRIVIPKEIRRSLNIKEGDPLEIFTDQEYVCFKKYSKADIINDNIEIIINAIRNKPKEETIDDFVIAQLKSIAEIYKDI